MSKEERMMPVHQFPEVLYLFNSLSFLCMCVIFVVIMWYNGFGFVLQNHCYCDTFQRGVCLRIRGTVRREGVTLIPHL